MLRSRLGRQVCGTVTAKYDDGFRGNERHHCLGHSIPGGSSPEASDPRKNPPTTVSRDSSSGYLHCRHRMAAGPALHRPVRKLSETPCKGGGAARARKIAQLRHWRAGEPYQTPDQSCIFKCSVQSTGEEVKKMKITTR